jgi:hypothetical protein
MCLVVVTLIQSVLYFRRPYPHWLYMWLWISCGIIFVGQLRAWWIPYLFHAEPERAARYQVMFEQHPPLPAYS